MRHLIACLLALLVGLAQPVLAQEPDWELVWADEFDDEGLPDPEKWTYEQGFVRNQELQYYTAERPKNARVEEGRLIIEAHKERYPNPHHDPDASDWQQSREYAQYTSASLTTRGLHDWRYGRIEVRARLPRGRGVWPAIWMLGRNIDEVGWPRCGEIDIMEYVGFNPHTIHANIHTEDYNHTKGTDKGSEIEVDSPWQDVRVYAVEWFPDRLDFYVDEHNYFTYEKEDGADEGTWPFDQPFHLLLNLAIGGSWGGQQGIDEAIFPQRYEIDYVRIYQQDSID